MADLNELNMHQQPREYDELEKALTTRPMLGAPRHTSARVLARIAALPQTEYVSTPMLLAARYPAPAIIYHAPAVLPLPEAIDALEIEAIEKGQRRLIFGLMFTGAWLGLCLLALWVIWPAISNLIFGPSSDPEMQARLATLQGMWNGLVGFLSDFWTAYAPIMPTIISGAVGLGLMTALIFGPTRFRRLRA